MTLYVVTEKVWGEYDIIPVSAFSTREKAEEAIAFYEKEYPDFTYDVEEWELDKI